MSKVIKSGYCKIESPRLINNFHSDLNLPVEPVVEENPDTPEPVIEETVDLEQVKKQADDIIQETEQMVKDLLGTARLEAEKIIKNAKEQADLLVREAQERQNGIKEQARTEGWNAGYQEGQDIARQEMEGTLAEAKRTLQDALEEREKIILEAEDEIIHLAVHIAQKIVGQEISTNPSIIVEIAQKALEKVRDREEISLRVNPENIDQVIEAKDKIVSSTQGIKKMKVLADPDITPGGCVIETSNGTVDARVERQLKEIEQSLLEVNANG